MDSKTVLPRAPRQVGGPAWRGPRTVLISRVDLTLGSVCRQSAAAAGLTVNDWIADVLRRAVTPTEEHQT
jgi:hypothetical protein